VITEVIAADPNAIIPQCYISMGLAKELDTNC
jgi:hypothetical protein